MIHFYRIVAISYPLAIVTEQLQEFLLVGNTAQKPQSSVAGDVLDMLLSVGESAEMAE